MWGAVAKQVMSVHDIGPSGAISYAEMNTLVSRVMNKSRLPTLLRGRTRNSDQLGDDIRRLVEVMRTVLTVVTKVSGCQVVVDSSKSAMTLAAFGLIPDLEITPLHLVRDPRAVTFSQSRQHQSPGVDQHLDASPRGPWYSALRWAGNSVLCHFVGRGFSGYRLLSYEHLATDPRDTMASVSNNLGLQPPVFLEPNLVQLESGHVLFGNPSRFGPRVRAIKLDERWRTEMPRSTRMAVTILTALPQFWMSILHSRSGRHASRVDQAALQAPIDSREP
jgi:hypothetical protein